MLKEIDRQSKIIEIAEDIERLIGNKIIREYERGHRDGVKDGQKNLEDGIEIHAKLSWSEYSSLNIWVDQEEIEKEMMWIRKELNPMGDKERGYEFSNRRFKVVILPLLDEDI
jgi:hypothetical protein